MQEGENKERSVDLDRQAELELLAERMIVSGGLAGFSIERLAQEAGYSRPTVYRHFSSKEDALSAAIVKAVALGEKLFKRLASPIVGNRREQAMAFFVALEQIARFHSNAFEVVEMLGFEWMREATSEDTQWQWAGVIRSSFRELEGALRDASNQGELSFRSELGPADVAFHSITMAFSTYASILRKGVCFQLADASDHW